MASRFKLVTFDVTNTILRFRISVGEEYARVGRVYGIERDPNQVSQAFLQNWKTMNKVHPNYGQATGLSSSQWWKELINRTFAHNSSSLTMSQLNSISNHLYELYKSNSCWKVTPGAVSLLENLKKVNVVLGVISNFDERLDCVLSSNDLREYFDFVIASYLVGKAKPDPKIFGLALNMVPKLAPSFALHIGDNVDLDYLAAKEAGWNALLLYKEDLHYNELLKVEPQEIAKDMKQIEQFILES